MKQIFKYWYVGFFGFLILLQFVQLDKTNPKFEKENDLIISANVKNDVAVILKKACYDCHSSETVWPWYSFVAPISFLVTHDVNEGRAELNFSEWATYSVKRKSKKLTEINEMVSTKEMPLPIYIPLHPEADLTTDEINLLLDWSETEYQNFNSED